MYRYAIFALVMGALLVLFHPTGGFGYVLVFASAFIIGWTAYEDRQRRLDARYHVKFDGFPALQHGRLYKVIIEDGWLWHEYQDNGTRLLVGPAPERRVPEEDWRRN